MLFRSLHKAKVPPHVRHTNRLETLRDDAETGETVHPLKLKDLQRSTAGKQAMDVQPRDEDIGKLKLLEQGEKKRGINIVDMAGPKADDAQGGRGAEHRLWQPARLWCSTTEREFFEASHRAGSEPLVERGADLAIPAEQADE